MAIHIPLKQLDEIEECVPLSPPQSHSNSKKGSPRSMNNKSYNEISIITVDTDNLFRMKSLPSPVVEYDSLLYNDKYDEIEDEINVQQSNTTIKANHISIESQGNNVFTINLSARASNKRYDDDYIHAKKESAMSQETVYRSPDNLILKNANKNKEIEVALEMKQEKKIIMKKEKMYSLFNDKNSLFYLFCFMSSEDLKSFYNVSKKFRMIMNLVIRNVYYNSIIPKIKRNNYYFEILRTKIHYSNVKKSLFKIDFIVNLRMIEGKTNPLITEHNSSLSEYKNVTFAFIYKNMKTSIENKKSKYADYFSFDILNSNTTKFPSIYMTREFTTFNMDNLQKTYIQPVLPFKTDDQAIINISIYSPENSFIDPNEIKVKYKLSPVPSVSKSSEEDPRVCEYEDICSHWKNLSFLEQKEIIMNQLISIFEPMFKICSVQYEDVGYLIFKVLLKAKECGVVKDKEELGINLRVKEKKDVIINEIKKNDLLFEKRNDFEVRIGDVIIFYLTNNK